MYLKLLNRSINVLPEVSGLLAGQGRSFLLRAEQHLSIGVDCQSVSPLSLSGVQADFTFLAAEIEDPVALFSESEDDDILQVFNAALSVWKQVVKPSASERLHHPYHSPGS